MASPLVLVYNISGSGFITLPIVNGTITSINWGDGTTNTSVSHNYGSTGTYTVQILGTGITTFDYRTGTGQGFLGQCTSFGSIGLINASNMFYNCQNLTVAPVYLPPSITNISSMFQNVFGFNGDISGWNTSNVTNMSNMFYGVSSFNQDIGGWDTSNVTNMTNMFVGANSFNQYIGGWNVSNVTTMSGMLDGTALSTNNYNALLNGWATQTVQPNVTLGVAGLIYTSAGAGGRDTLTSAPNNWNITGDTSALVFVYNITVSSFTLTLPINTGSITSINWGDGTTNTLKTHTYANSGTYTVQILGNGINTFNYSTGTGQEYLTSCTDFGSFGLVDASNMFYNCSNLTAVPATLSSIYIMSGMFQNASRFNGNISGWNTTNVTDMNNMFNGATAFNQNIGGWNTTNVYNMINMFNGATSFNQNIGGWIISNVRFMGAMLNGTALSTTNYDALLNGWAAQTVQPNVQLGAEGLIYTYRGLVGRNALTRAPKNWTILGDIYQPYPCFKEGSKILTDTGYIPIENLKNGDMIKTFKHGFKPIVMIGKKVIYNPAEKERIKEQLYKCSKNKYPDIFEDLVITGCHSILVENLVTRKQIERIKEVAGDTYFTDDKLRLPACVDDRASVYEVKGDFTIYHIALENDDYYMNYGVYANGLLVETCSKRYLKKLSKMELIE